MPKLLEHWPPVIADIHWVCFSFDSDSYPQISTFENQRLGPPERILPW